MKNSIALLFILTANMFCFGQDNVALNKMCFNTGFDEFGLRIIDGKFHLVSANRDTIEGGPYIDESIGKPFFDLYTVDQCKLAQNFMMDQFLLEKMDNFFSFLVISILIITQEH